MPGTPHEQYVNASQARIKPFVLDIDALADLIAGYLYAVVEFVVLTITADWPASSTTRLVKGSNSKWLAGEWPVMNIRFLVLRTYQIHTSPDRDKPALDWAAYQLKTWAVPGDLQSALDQLQHGASMPDDYPLLEAVFECPNCHVKRVEPTACCISQCMWCRSLCSRYQHCLDPARMPVYMLPVASPTLLSQSMARDLRDTYPPVGIEEHALCHAASTA